MPCYHIHIIGAVFKTGFRYFLKAKADLSEVTGFVFYEDDQSVGIIASGSEKKINNFLKFCKAGFSQFHIQNTKITEISHKEYSSFEVVDKNMESFDLQKE